MKVLIGMAVGVTALALSAPAFGQSVSVGTLTCGDAAQQVQMSLSYYDIGSQANTNTGSQSSGAGAGKVVFEPLEIHTDPGEFPLLLQMVEMGYGFKSCTLVTSGSKRGGASFEFDLVTVKSVNAIGGVPPREDAAPSEYTDVVFEYGAMKSLN